jgi:hypothetical protein
LYLEQHGGTQVFSFEQLLYLYVLDVALRTGEISLDEGKVLLQTMAEHYAKFRGKNCELMFVRKLGIATCLLAASPSEVYFESGARVVVRLNLPTCIEQLKLKLA